MRTSETLLREIVPMIEAQLREAAGLIAVAAFNAVTHPELSFRVLAETEPLIAEVAAMLNALGVVERLVPP